MMAFELWKKYTDRNLMTTEEMDELYIGNFGVARSAMNHRFLDRLNRDARILEVGSNVGLQLQFLQEMGFQNLCGIESLPYAVQLSKKETNGINITQGDARDIPFRDNSFDLVFTSGLLIHINPDKLRDVMVEIYRCSKQYIWGYEYYETEITPIDYRGDKDLLWKGDYSKMYCDYFNLEVLDIELLSYKDDGNRDVMFLLEKQ